MSDLVIGIDLGTTKYCVSLYENGRTRILENDSGGRTTPSFIYFKPGGRFLIGEDAKEMEDEKAENGIYEMKRLIGKTYEDSQLQESLKYLPFDVSKDSSEMPVVSVKQRGRVVKKTPQQLYTMLLREIKMRAQEKLKQNIDKAVISVPANFSVTQREITLAAAKDAGFTVLKLLNEPTAAALAFHFERHRYNIYSRRSVVYDLGGGTFDFAIIDKYPDRLEVLAASGDPHLGGHDFDNCILNYVSRILKNKYKYDTENNMDAKRRLRNKCEEAKKDLSSVEETLITIDGMVPKHPKIRITITRRQFEIMARKLFQKTMDIVEDCFRSSKICNRHIHDVIMCGGSTRIPKIEEMVTLYFGRSEFGSEKVRKVNPDESVAEGTAIQAAMLSSDLKQKVDVQLAVMDILPVSLGLSSFGNKMIFLIEKNTKIPASAQQVYSNKEADETSIALGIFEGERLDSRKNRFLGTLHVTDIQPAPPFQAAVTVTLGVDHNGILTATAEENGRALKVNYTRVSRSDPQAKNTLMVVKENKKLDKKFADFVQHKYYLYAYCESILYNLKNSDLIDSYSEVYSFCEETKKFAYEAEMYQEKLVSS